MSDRARRLHASPWLGAIYVTGGGSGLLSEMLSTAGASGTVIDAGIPYASEALTDLLGRAPAQAASQTTARAMAVAAFNRGQTLKPNVEQAQLFGLGCTASLATNREKRGQTRAHWSIHTQQGTSSYQLVLDKQLSRQDQEIRLVDEIWASLERDLLNTPATDAVHDINEHVQRYYAASSAALAPLFAQTPYRHAIGEPHPLLLLPGSFNPMHQGHTQMLQIAESITGLPGAFELSVINADKPPWTI